MFTLTHFEVFSLKKNTDTFSIQFLRINIYTMVLSQHLYIFINVFSTHRAVLFIRILCYKMMSKNTELSW